MLDNSKLNFSGWQEQEKTIEHSVGIKAKLKNEKYFLI
jgi:hypothetical protein